MHVHVHMWSVTKSHQTSIRYILLYLLGVGNISGQIVDRDGVVKIQSMALNLDPRLVHQNTCISSETSKGKENLCGCGCMAVRVWRLVRVCVFNDTRSSRGGNAPHTSSMPDGLGNKPEPESATFQCREGFRRFASLERATLG